MYKTLSQICMYVDEYLFPPGRNWGSIYFQEQSYSRWAANQVIDAISFNNGEPAIQILNEYLNYYQEAARETEDKDKRFIFEAAADTVADILIKLEKENNNGYKKVIQEYCQVEKTDK